MNQADLNPAVRRYIKTLEKRLDRKCRKMGSHTTNQGETFLFGEFWRNRESIVATIAVQNCSVNGGWLPMSVGGDSVR